MTPWGTVQIADVSAPGPYSVVGGPFGSTLGRKDYVDEGVPVIRGAQLSGPSAFSHDELVFVSEDKADRQKGNLAFPGDIIVTQRGTVGQIGRIPIDAPFPRYLLSQSQMKLTVDPQKADPRYVYYALLAPEAQHALRASTITAGVPHINLASFRALALPMPPLDIQSRIASVLDDLDRSIENHRLRIELLEHMAEAIYREWFVRFRYPGYEGVSHVDSPAGCIPQSWSVTSLGDAGTWLSGGTPRTSVTEYWGGPYPWITSGALTSMLLDRSERTLTERGVANGSRLVDRDTLLFVVRGMSLVKEFRVGIADVTLAFGQDCKAVVARAGIEPLYLAFGVIAQAAKIQSMVELAGHGTGKLSTDRLKALPLLVPPADLQRAFAEAITPLRELSTTLRLSNDQLIRLRTELLPGLVSGQIDISQIDLDELVDPAS